MINDQRSSHPTAITHKAIQTANILHKEAPGGGGARAPLCGFRQAPCLCLASKLDRGTGSCCCCWQLAAPAGAWLAPRRRDVAPASGVRVQRELHRARRLASVSRLAACPASTLPSSFAFASPVRCGRWTLSHSGAQQLRLSRTVPVPGGALRRAGVLPRGSLVVPPQQREEGCLVELVAQHARVDLADRLHCVGGVERGDVAL